MMYLYFPDTPRIKTELSCCDAYIYRRTEGMYTFLNIRYKHYRVDFIGAFVRLTAVLS
jgi:hypothetical protein